MINRRKFLAFGVGSALMTPFVAKPSTSLAHEQGLAARPLPSFAKRRVGSAEVTVLMDGTIDMVADGIIGFDREVADQNLKRQHLPAFGKGRPMPILGHVIDTGDKKIAIDTGTPAGFAETAGGYHSALRQAGIDPAEIDTVLMTHLHVDHVGGLVAGKKPAFPNAELVVNAPEWDFWHGSGAEALPEQMKFLVDAARNFTMPYKEKLRLFSGAEEVLPGIQAVQLPGHTPGHVGFHLHSNGEDLLFWADLIHLPRLQFDNPDWLIPFDIDPAQTSETRAKFLDMAATDGLQVTGSHLEFPSFGYVDRVGRAYRFAPAPYDYSLQ